MAIWLRLRAEPDIPCSTSEFMGNLSVIAGGGALAASLTLGKPAAVLCSVAFGAAVTGRIYGAEKDALEVAQTEGEAMERRWTVRIEAERSHHSPDRSTIW